MKTAVAILAAVVCAYGQTKADWVEQVKNKPMLDVREYNFRAQTPGGTLSASVAATANLRPCPSGISADSASKSYVRISGGTGTAEAVQISSFTTITGGCRIGFTPANNHSGAWTIASATAGVQEAVIVASTGAQVYIPAGSYAFYAPVWVNKSLGVIGSDVMGTTVVAQSGNGIFDVHSNEGVSFRWITMTSTGSYAAYGVRLQGTDYSNYYSRIENCRFYKVTRGVYAVHGYELWIANNRFTNFQVAAIVADDSTYPDAGGPHVIDNMISNDPDCSGCGGETAGVLIKSTGSIIVTGNSISGTYHGVYVDHPTVSGQLVISGNDIENTLFSAITLTGAYLNVSITGNTLVQFSIAGNWWGIYAQGTGAYGIKNLSVTGNVFYGMGTSSHNVGLQLVPNVFDFNITGNTFDGLEYAVLIDNGVPGTVGPNTLGNVGTGTMGLGNQCRVIFPASWPYFATLGAWADGSMLYVADSNANCTANGGTGQICKRINGAWTN